MNISDRLGEAPERERLPLTSKSLAEELALIHIPGWRVESAIYSVEYSRGVSVGRNGFCTRRCLWVIEDGLRTEDHDGLDGRNLPDYR